MNITDPLFDLAKSHPQGDAIIALGGTLTYADLARAVSSTAARFRKEGLAPGDAAAISLPHQLQLLVASLALAHLGVGQTSSMPDPPELLRDLRSVQAQAVIARRDGHG
jgi:non-ribosomal peptide synthetase component E (peptide arylation enzyme)